MKGVKEKQNTVPPPPPAVSNPMPAPGGTQAQKKKPGRKLKRKHVGSRKGMGGRPKSPPPPLESNRPQPETNNTVDSTTVPSSGTKTTFENVKASVSGGQFLIMKSGTMCQPCQSLHPPQSPSPMIPPPQGTTEQRITRQQSSSSMQTPGHLQVPNHIWTSQYSTCFDMKLHPVTHKHVVCNKCLRFFDNVLGMDLDTTPPKSRSEYNAQHFKCDRPWSHQFSGRGSTTGQQHRRSQIFELHGEALPEDAEECVESGDVVADNVASEDEEVHVVEALDSGDTGRLLLGDRVTFRVPEEEDVDKVFVLGSNGRGYLVTLREKAKKKRGGVYSVVTPGKSIPVVTQEHPGCSTPAGVVNKRGEITVEAAESIGVALEHRQKQRSRNVLSHELRLAGKIISLSFSSQLDCRNKIKTLKLYHFKHSVPFDIARVPRITKKEVTHVNIRKQYAYEWLEALPDTLLYHVIGAALELKPELSSLAITAFQSRNSRLSPERTATIQTYVGMNDKQLRRLSRSFSFYGIPPIFASQHSLEALKKAAVDDEYKTLKCEVIPLQRKVKLGKKDVIYRDYPTLVH